MIYDTVMEIGKNGSNTLIQPAMNEGGTLTKIWKFLTQQCLNVDVKYIIRF